MHVLEQIYDVIILVILDIYYIIIYYKIYFVWE